MHRFQFLVPLAAVAALAICANAADGDLAQTPIAQDNLDPATFAEWVDGAERSLVDKDRPDSTDAIRNVLWTDKSRASHGGMSFGQSKQPGPRHLRIGLKSAVDAGAVMVRGGGKVSVLKPDAKYPGDLADDSQWLAAERIVDGKLSQREVGEQNYSLWTLPKKTSTRAIRFTHDADVTERDYAGRLLGAFVLGERVANIATQAAVAVSANTKSAAKINNEHIDPTWEQWGNSSLDAESRPTIVSTDDPEWAMLVWPAAVKLRGVGTMFAGFREADVQIFTGAANVHPREAKDDAWKTVGQFKDLSISYPIALGCDWLDFGQVATTRAIRIRMTRAMQDNQHPHTHGHTKDGKRVWLGELVALMPLADEQKASAALLPQIASAEQPPIPIKFTMPADGFVTLVIDDAEGKRIRNLIADTPFAKGEHTVWWDGSDDLARDPSAASHGLYYIPTQLVAPGNYTVRGLWRKQVDIKHELSTYTNGNPAWNTSDASGGWLANHTPPCAVLFVPDGGRGEPSVLIGSYVSEGGSGLAWVDLDGRKWKGQNWVGGVWTGAPYLARDAREAAEDVVAYAASAWSAGEDADKKPLGEIRITALLNSGERGIVKHIFKATSDSPDGKHVHWESQISGLAVHSGIAIVSLPAINRVVLIDIKNAKVLGEAELAAPMGVAFDVNGKLFAITGDKLVRFAAAKTVDDLRNPTTIVEKLDAPHGLAISVKGDIYISQRGASHQVKVFSPAGKLLATIGKPGVPQAGKYDPLHMNNPRGLTLDRRGRLWVAEEDSQPKRVSVWNADGSLAAAYYGPADYGGGGELDGRDKAKFYYNGMELAVDWQTGKDNVAAVIYRPQPEDLKLPDGAGMPQTALTHNGRRYWSNALNSSPTGGNASAFLFIERDGVAVPVAGAGRAQEWALLKDKAFAASWPPETKPDAHAHSHDAATYVWSDISGDGRVQPDELKIYKGLGSGFGVGPDLSLVIARWNGKATQLAPTKLSDNGVPLYDMASAKTLVEGAQGSPSSGGDQLLVGPDGWTIHTSAPQPFSNYGIGGAKNGKPLWSYASLWPGLHASHEAPVPDRPGMLIGHTRLASGIITPRGGEPLWAINTNHGPICLFTVDGLFVAQLFQDMRLGRPWQMPIAVRGMKLNELTPSDENFWPSVTQSPEGEIFVNAGRPNSIARVAGLETIRRFPPLKLSVTAKQLGAAQEYFAKQEAMRQAQQGRGTLLVELAEKPPTVDGKVEDWADADWAEIDKRGSRAYFDSNTEPYNVTGAVAIAGDRLYAAWRTNDKDLLKNSGELPLALFKTGGALDLMIGASAKADPQRKAPVAGDQRLLVTMVEGKPRAVLYRAVADDKKPTPFSSPWRTINFDRVDDVTGEIQLAGEGGNFEVSVPLKLLGLTPTAGQTIQGDIGILRGAGNTTTQRVYWSNKATAIVADVPSEAELRPNLWGRFEFVKPK